MTAILTMVRARGVVVLCVLGVLVACLAEQAHGGCEGEQPWEPRAGQGRSLAEPWSSLARGSRWPPARALLPARAPLWCLVAHGALGPVSGAGEPPQMHDG